VSGGGDEGGLPAERLAATDRARDDGAAGGVLGRLRGRAGRRVLLVLLLVGLAVIGWWYVGRMPAEGRVEIRWTESPPTSVSLGYTDDDGRRVRVRQEAIAPGMDRFTDSYKLAPGRYWLRIEVRHGARVRTIRKRVELPTVEPLVLWLEELPEADLPEGTP
jgi:hypothetical protein